MSIDASYLEEYIKLFLESEEDEQVDEMTTVASVGTMGYVLPLGTSNNGKKKNKKDK